MSNQERAGGWTGPGVLLLASAALLWSGVCAVGETVWFGGTQRALPVSLAAWKDDGLSSRWGVNNHGDDVWDFNLGTDISVWQHTNATSFQSMGPRFGVATRFQFNSGSFDLWATDLRGGGVYGIRMDRLAFEAFFYHESSHLGDEILDRGERARIDYNVNGLRLTASWDAEDWLRVYGGASVQPWAKPETLQSFGFHAGVEITRLPPWERGYVAMDAEAWEWRSWNPDASLQAGIFIGPKGRGGALEAARFYLEFRTGRVMLGQYYNETESYFGIGLGTNW
jgi:hypothetical protein